MVTVDARAVGVDDATFVVGTLRGGSTPVRVTVANRLDGPVWPPRRMGEPEAGWDESGYEGVVPAGESIAIGYACPAPPAEPPLEIVESERVEESDMDFTSAASVLRGLGSPAPPREALALPAENERDDSEGSLPTSTEPPLDPEVPEHDRPDENGQAGDAGPTPSDDATARECEPPGDVELPGPIATWLDRVEERIERAERLATAEDVPGATDALRDVGSLDAAMDLERRRHSDARCLRELTKCANALSDRAERAEIPVETLSRLA